MVFYVYGSRVEFKRYTNQRYKPMKHFDKKKLHDLTKFAHKQNTGLVHHDFKNIFVNFKPAEDDEIKRVSTMGNYKD